MEDATTLFIPNQDFLTIYLKEGKLMVSTTNGNFKSLDDSITIGNTGIIGRFLKVTKEEA